MPDLINKLLKTADHNRFTTLAAMILAGVLVYAGGCTSTTTAYNGEELNRQGLESAFVDDIKELASKQATLDAEREALVAKGNIALDDLDMQDAHRTQTLEIIGGLVTQFAAGTVNPATAITGALSLGSVLLAGGAAIDNRRKDSVIRKMKAGEPDPQV